MSLFAFALATCSYGLNVVDTKGSNKTLTATKTGALRGDYQLKGESVTVYGQYDKAYDILSVTIRTPEKDPVKLFGMIWSLLVFVVPASSFCILCYKFFWGCRPTPAAQARDVPVQQDCRDASVACFTGCWETFTRHLRNRFGQPEVYFLWFFSCLATGVQVLLTEKAGKPFFKAIGGRRFSRPAESMIKVTEAHNEPDCGMPSGHSCNSVMYLTWVVREMLHSFDYNVKALYNNRKAFWFLMTVVVINGPIGFSRFVNRDHTGCQVFFGSLLGFIFGWFGCFNLSRSLMQRKQDFSYNMKWDFTAEVVINEVPQLVESFLPRLVSVVDARVPDIEGGIPAHSLMPVSGSVVDHFCIDAWGAYVAMALQIVTVGLIFCLYRDAKAEPLPYWQ